MINRLSQVTPEPSAALEVPPCAVRVVSGEPLPTGRGLLPGGRATVGVGAADSPRLAMVFMVPTARNPTVHPRSPWVPFPFAGNPRFWKWLVKWSNVSLNPDESDLWDDGVAHRHASALVDQGLYLTNFVKRPFSDSTNPTARQLKAWEASLHTELRSIRARRVMVFGGLPCSVIASRSITLRDVAGSEFLKLPHGQVFIANYFPVGRGKPGESGALLARELERSGESSPLSIPPY